ncbi:MAG: amino acid ABC transporter substrate-binding protein [Oscillospiraceae bacterium]
MKKFIMLILACAIMFSVTACTTNEQSAEKSVDTTTKTKLVLGLDDSFPPMGFRDENNEIVGLDIDLAKGVCAELGVELELKPIDWSTKELELNSRKIDCIWNGLTYKDELNEAFLLSTPYLANNQIIAVRTKDNITDKASLAEKTIGVQTGSTAEKALSQDSVLGENSIAKGYADNVTALQDLKLGRVDAVVLDEVVARYYATKETEVTVLEGSLAEEVYVVAFRKDDKQLLEDYEKAFKKILENGKAEEISTKWFGKDVILR